LVIETVDGYVGWLAAQLSGRAFKSITIQGVPAPGYPLKNKIHLGEEEKFLLMIRLVNEKLKRSVNAQGWYFLDVYDATVNKHGLGNAIWHLDGWHIKPEFYQQAVNYCS